MAVVIQLSAFTKKIVIFIPDKLALVHFLEDIRASKP